jgi:hypothetical protein
MKQLATQVVTLGCSKKISRLPILKRGTIPDGKTARAWCRLARKSCFQSLNHEKE